MNECELFASTECSACYDKVVNHLRTHSPYDIPHAVERPTINENVCTWDAFISACSQFRGIKTNVSHIN